MNTRPTMSDNKFYDLFGIEILPIVTANKQHIAASFKLEELKKERENNKNSHLVNYLSISPRKIVRYTKNENAKLKDFRSYWLAVGAILNDDGSLTISPELRASQKKNKIHSGTLSNKANNRVQTAIDWMMLLSKEKESLNHAFKSFYKWKLNFVTLTLCAHQVHSDKWIKDNLLNQFLVELRKYCGVENYLWRAESQSSGNIHFHIVTDKFLPWQELRDRWNRIQKKGGYTVVFSQKFGHENPNSTDIHSLKKVKNVAAYLSKYVGKNSKGLIIHTAKSFHITEKKFLFLNSNWLFPPTKAKYFRPIFGKLWSCSEKISKLGKLKVKQSDEMCIQLSAFEYKNPLAAKVFDYVKIWSCKAENLVVSGLTSIREVLKIHVLKILYPEIQLEISV